LHIVGKCIATELQPQPVFPFDEYNWDGNPNETLGEQGKYCIRWAPLLMLCLGTGGLNVLNAVMAHSTLLSWTLHSPATHTALCDSPSSSLCGLPDLGTPTSRCHHCESYNIQSTEPKPRL
jgi:hypothetical protein